MPNELECYMPEINAINDSLIRFNQYLKPEYAIPRMDPGTMIADKNCVRILHKNWNGFGFPNAEKRGVYFMFGREQTSGLNGLYIGKSSFRHTIGKRLYTHLSKYRNSDYFVRDHYNSEVYILDWIASIDLDSSNTTFLASSLEEYLITDTRDRIRLLNGTGN